MTPSATVLVDTADADMQSVLDTLDKLGGQAGDFVAKAKDAEDFAAGQLTAALGT